MKKDYEKLVEGLILRYAMSPEEAKHFAGFFSRKVITKTSCLVCEYSPNTKVYILLDGSAMAAYDDDGDYNKTNGTLSWITNQIQVLNYVPIHLSVLCPIESLYAFKGSIVYYAEYEDLKEAIQSISDTSDLYFSYLQDHYGLTQERAICLSKGSKLKAMQHFNQLKPGILKPKEKVAYKIPQWILAEYFIMARGKFWEAMKKLL